MEKILFVHPLGYSLEEKNQDIARIANLMPPIGLLSIAAYLNKNNIPNYIIDCFLEINSDKQIQSFIETESPTYLAMSTTTSSFLDGIRIAKNAKNLKKNLKIVFGGPHISALKETLLDQFPVIDYLVVGEGEETFLELIKSKGNNVANIEGLVRRNEDNIAVFNGYRKKLLELDNLPFPAYEKLKGYPDNYKLPIFNYPKAPNSSAISSRGCPYKCSYCDRSVFKSTFRYNSAEYLYDHLKYLKDNFGIKHINFYDDQFTFNRQRVEKFCKLVIDKRLGMTFNCAVRAEHIDLELLKDMKKAGAWMASIGIETGDENLLAMHRQNANLQMIREKITLIKKAKIRAKGLLMMGLPHETEESIKKSMKYVFSLPLDDFNLSKFTPFPGSPLYKNIDEYGDFDEKWEKMDCMHFLFVPKTISKERLEYLYINFYKKHFMRLKVVFSYITMIFKSPDSWKRFIKNIFYFIKFIKKQDRIL